METIWILGDQLSRDAASLEDVAPGEARVLVVESAAKLDSKRWHRQRLHLVLTAMRRFADELRDAGFAVDHRRASSLRQGLADHRREHEPERVRVMEPMSWDGREMLRDLDVEIVRSNQFLCHYEEFAEWADGRDRLVMEDFYRWQRRRLDVLMDGDEPEGGRWNYDRENREPPPEGDRDPWPEPQSSRLDDLDREVLADLPDGVFGREPDGTWATTRRAALARLRHFCERVLPGFGPHQDAMTERSWHLAHSLLSPYLNLGMLHPEEVVRAAEETYRSGDAPIASVEGFVRQILGWREYVWGMYWLRMPEFRERNELEAERALPPLFEDPEKTEMACVRSALESVERHAYAHHIQRLMIFGNLGLVAGTRPAEMVDWMHASFIDGADWVMVPNVVGMALHADGGEMMTKPYAASGAYIDRMSDHCSGCRYDRKQRTGDDACPFTTLYWSFLERHRDRFADNHRMGRQLANLDRLGDLDAVRSRAEEVLAGLERGEV